MKTRLLAQTDEQYKAGATVSAARLSKSSGGQADVAKWAAASDRGAAAQLMFDDMVTDARAGLPSIKAKLWVVYAYDAVMGPQTEVDDLYKGAYASAPSAKLMRVEGSYHFIMLDQPEAFAKDVDAFLK